jgi:hypothetical protein
MRKATVIGLLLGLALTACNPLPRVTTPLSAPDPTLFDKRMSGTWFSSVDYLQQAIASDGWRSGYDLFQLAPSRDVPSFDIGALAVWRAGSRSVTSVNGTAFASRIDGETYYNVHLAGEANDSFLIVGVRMAGDSTVFLEFMDPSLVKKLADQHRINIRSDHDGAYQSELPVIDASREELIALIREIGPDTLFSEIRGPFYRVAERTHDAVVSSTDRVTERGATFGAWKVECEKIPGDDRFQYDCRIRDERGSISAELAGDGPGVIKVGDDRCATSGVEMQVDDAASLHTEAKGAHDAITLFERMLLGRVLHVSYTACPGNEMKRIDVPLTGFAAAYAFGRGVRLGVFPLPEPREPPPLPMLPPPQLPPRDIELTVHGYTGWTEARLSSL